MDIKKYIENDNEYYSIFKDLLFDNLKNKLERLKN